MVSNYVLLIERQNGISLEDVEKYLKTEFRSEDYMMGFLYRPLELSMALCYRLLHLLCTNIVFCS